MLVFDKRLGCLESASAGEEFGHRMVEANNIVFKLAGELKLSFPLYRVGLFQFDNKEAFPYLLFNLFHTTHVTVNDFYIENEFITINLLFFLAHCYTKVATNGRI